MRRTVISLLVLVALTGCGGGPMVSGALPAPTPYGGPMSVPVDDADEANVAERSGAAGRSLECDGKPYRGGIADYSDGLVSVQDSGKDALQDVFTSEGFANTLPDNGYRVERTDGGRVLYSYDVAKHTKIAFIASDAIKDYKHQTGWGIESWAQCDPAEFPESVTRTLGIDVWQDASGARVPISRVQSFKGAEHCNWEDVTFLRVVMSGTTVEYVRDPYGTLEDSLPSAYDGSATLPDRATDTGLRHAGRQLWLGPDRAAYLVNLDDNAEVERWPAAERSIGCA
ncbi:MAG: hypothetical protein ABIR57_06960 [Aeromicrobium sp.]